MAKLTLSDVSNVTGNETSFVNTFNANNTLIETALENTLSRDGTSPNPMEADLDMNGNDILNIGALRFGTSSSTLEQVLINTPDTTTDNAIVRWDGTDGTAIQDSGWLINDSDVMTAGGNLDMSNNNISGVINLTLTGGGTLDGNDGVVTEIVLKDVSETAYDMGNLTGNVSVDYTDGHYQYGDLTGNITITDVSNWSPSGTAGGLTLELTNTGNFTVSWDSEFKHPGGTAPTMTTGANSKDLFVVSGRSASDLNVTVAGQDLS